MLDRGRGDYKNKVCSVAFRSLGALRSVCAGRRAQEKVGKRQKRRNYSDSFDIMQF